jgi:hypothetical protein
VVLGEVDIVLPLNAAAHSSEQDADKIGDVLYGVPLDRIMSVFYRHHCRVCLSTYLEDVDLPYKHVGLGAHLATDKRQRERL